MESPYAPPQAPAPLLKKLPAGSVARVTTRIIGVLAVFGAGALLRFSGRLSAFGEELNLYDRVSSPIFARLLLWDDGILPFLAAVALAAAGTGLSFRRRGRALPMLALVLAAVLLSLSAYFGLYLLILEFIRVAGV